MSGWEGFTDEDLQRVKHQAGKPDGATRTRGGARGRPGFRKKPQRSSGLQPQGANQQGQMDLPPEQRLSAPPSKPDIKSEVKKPEKTENKEKSVNTGPGEVKTKQGPDSQKDTQNNGWETQLKEEAEDLMDEEEIVSLEMSNLDKFREQQKMIEELNRKKKQILASAIQKRQKQAKAEATKLMQVQKELEKLDQLLTVDVSIIRDRIEDATREYSDAQKRYDRAEKEFITSKMHLFETQEQKEQLTEHLYTVIHQNEVRKAKKLKELMEKLEVENSGEDSELSELVSHMEVPSLTVLNSMQTKTIHGPRSPPVNPRVTPQASTTKLSTEESQNTTEQGVKVGGQAEGTNGENGQTQVQQQVTVDGDVSDTRTKSEDTCDTGDSNGIKDKESTGNNNTNCQDSIKESSKTDPVESSGKDTQHPPISTQNQEAEIVQ